MGNQVLLACGMAAGPLFTVAYLLQGASRVGYRPFRHPVSSLAFGRAGWVQTVNFLLAGLLPLVFAVGLWRVGFSRWGALLIGAWAVGLLGAGAFGQIRWPTQRASVRRRSESGPDAQRVEARHSLALFTRTDSTCRRDRAALEAPQ